MRNIFILALFVMVSCQASQTSKAVGSSQDDSISGLNAQWTLIEVKGQNVNQLSYNSTPAIEFNTEEGRINGSDGCNNFFGQLEELDNKKIKILIQGSTKAYCPEIKNSDMLGQYLHGVSTYKLKRDILILFDESGNEILRYQRSK